MLAVTLPEPIPQAGTLPCIEPVVLGDICTAIPGGIDVPAACWDVGLICLSDGGVTGVSVIAFPSTHGGLMMHSLL